MIQYTVPKIKINQKLQNLKVGYQGTNFSATEEEFDELLKIVSDRGIVDPPTKTINEIISLETNFQYQWN